MRLYPGNYSDYVEQKLSEQEHQLQTYHNQQAEIRRMRQDIIRTKQQALNVELTTTSREPGVRRYAKKVAKKALSREKKLERFLELDDLVERPRPSWQIKLDFAAPDHVSRDVLVTENLSIGYPGHEPLLTRLPPSNSRRGTGGADGSERLRENDLAAHHRRETGTSIRVCSARSVRQTRIHDPGTGTPRPD